jgi:predicted DNA binding CopG/RHH family protein
LQIHRRDVWLIPGREADALAVIPRALTIGTHCHTLGEIGEWDYAFDPEKNAWLIQERGISFDRIIALIEGGVRRARGQGRPDPVSQDNLSEPKGDQETHEGRTKMKKHGFDDEENKLITAYERGEFKPLKDQKGAKRTAVRAARRYMRKDARINIRLSTADLEMLKQRAVEEGLPYQSLIASVLHKYVSRGVLSGKKEG